MARVVIIGAGFAGHTAALYLNAKLGKEHQVTVVNRYDYFGFVPSWVWVGVGRMHPKHTTIPLKSVYDKRGIGFVHGSVTEIHPDENYVSVSRQGRGGIERLDYDYLLIATGPKLNFEATPGLGPHGGYSTSICTLDHTLEARESYLEHVRRMQKGERFRFVIGTGHPAATCQGAALEYIANIHKDLVKRKLRDRADLVYLSNEPELGDFGVGGLYGRFRGRMMTSEEFISAVYKHYGITSFVQRGVHKVDAKKIYWEDYDGKYGETSYDFSMLIPQFTGQPMKYIGRNGEDVSEKVVMPNGLIKVDAIYGLDYETLCKRPEAWPATYQNPSYANIFAAGISFAPPGPISKPHITPNGTSISAAPPRTGMIAGVIGRLTALNIADLINGGTLQHRERMTEMFAACVASMGDSLWDGEAAAIFMYPVVPDYNHYPNSKGRDPNITHMEMGTSGAWMKRMVHETFMHKFRGRPGWQIIPE
ncbi:NAD(P)/FAD-dependent oxidoreductase [Candidatus Oscillochloris fontis]|uniref:NAD(P)/FAD-dependent oxidoreductase n=1 Tax=Candidatus Oscillochloris fontis TaxID=2496868 RepID=UPI00101D807D|nr:FAD-dependent oxidoreductase [Candidatus Oscillochloris fontis]